jgi:cytochrome c553
MNRCAVIAALTLGLSLPVAADDQSAGKSQSAYTPRLAEMMISTQLRHFKLWYAGRVGNWDLPKYELAQIKTSLADAPKYYPNVPAADMGMLEQPVGEVGDAIEAKDSANFAKAFGRLTAACNSCHEATGFRFVEIREPRLSPIETSPFSDQAFSH